MRSVLRIVKIAHNHVAKRRQINSIDAAILAVLFDAQYLGRR